MNLKEAMLKIDSLKAEIPGIIKGAEEVAVQRAWAEMLRRIFNEGKDSGEESLGRYSLSWSKVRAKAGRQTNYKDLEFTGKLRRSIIIGESNGSVVIGILKQSYKNKSDTVKVSESLEAMNKKDIFKLTNDEIEAAKEAGSNFFIREIMKRI